MYINEAILEKGKKEDALFVFLHCQRTGGSNFQRWIVDVFGEDNSYTQKSPDYEFHWRDLKDFSILDGKAVVGGFSFFRDHQIGRPIVFMSNVRHPAYRILSLHYLAKKKETHFLHDLTKKSMAEFYREGRERKAWYFDDLQTKRLAGGKLNAKLAIQNVKDHFGIVGLTDELSATSKYLVDYYGWSAKPMDERDGPKDAERYEAKYDSGLLREIEKNNPNDMALYNFVREQNS